MARHVVRLDAAVLVARPHAVHEHVDPGDHRRVTASPTADSTAGRASAAASAPAPTSGTTPTPRPGSSRSWSGRPARCRTSARPGRTAGLIRFRGETAGDSYATDGQSGVVLRCYREHQMSADDAFLKRNWPKIKKAMEYLLSHDADRDGVLEGRPAEHAGHGVWFGPNSA